MDICPLVKLVHSKTFEFCLLILVGLTVFPYGSFINTHIANTWFLLIPLDSQWWV
jgi:predicted ABC-type exoprotein transport system permease subunit